MGATSELRLLGECLAEEIRFLCQTRSLTQRQLAELLYMNRGVLSRKMNMRNSEWTLSELLRVAHALGVTLTSLLQCAEWRRDRTLDNEAKSVIG